MIKVAAYCRVSTDKDDQANSFESQQKYFKDYIERNPDWELTEIYADKGLTGTSTKKRIAFQKMINDAEMGKFSLILTKEVSRFARNTVDTILYSRRLKDKNIGVIFMLDNINTLDTEGELRLTIMASLAQEESRKTSERVKWGQKRQMEKGVVFGRSMLGYDVINGKIYINEQGAEIVKLILSVTRDKSIIDEIVLLIAEVLTVDTPYYKIEGKDYSAEFVKDRMLKVNFEKLEAFLIEFERKTDKIHNMKAYLITSLFNMPATADATLSNTVKHDLYWN